MTFNCSATTIKSWTQRYHTIGDWWFRNGGSILNVRVSDMRNWNYEVLITVHELIEAVLCHSRGIDGLEVDEWDLAHSEAGDDPSAPYHKEHVFAESVERMLAAELGVDWDTYNDAVEEVLHGSKDRFKGKLQQGDSGDSHKP